MVLDILIDLELKYFEIVMMTVQNEVVAVLVSSDTFPQPLQALKCFCPSGARVKRSQQNRGCFNKNPTKTG